jgi:hypothetical protein
MAARPKSTTKVDSSLPVSLAPTGARLLSRHSCLLRPCAEGALSRSTYLAACLVVLPLLLGGCKRFQRKHVPVARVEELGYPTCAGRALPKGELLGSEHLRSGPVHPDKQVVERYAIKRRDCMTAVEIRQEWPLGTADVEVLYDAQLLPVRVWKRMSLPGIERAEERVDIRRYELRTDPVSVKLRSMEGTLSFEQLLGGRPKVVIGPGRGLLSMWIKRAKLQVGEKARELAIDVRGLEKIEPVTLLREVDMQHPELGAVRTYTFYGRETVFVNEHDLVVGDLMGMRADRVLSTPPPPALPMVGTPDPVATP